MSRFKPFLWPFSTFIGHSKSGRILKLHDWFNSNSYFPELGGFYLLVKFHRGGSATNMGLPRLQTAHSVDEIESLSMYPGSYVSERFHYVCSCIFGVGVMYQHHGWIRDAEILNQHPRIQLACRRLYFIPEQHMLIIQGRYELQLVFTAQAVTWD